MTPTRQKYQQEIMKFLKELDSSGYNCEMYEKIFENMSDREFDEYMKGVADETKAFIIFAPLYKSSAITTENNIKLAEKYKLPLFERIEVTNNPNMPDYVSHQDYLLLDLPVKRQAQNIVTKSSIPDNNRTIDYMTYQPTGDSKGSKLSMPELNSLIAMGLHNSVEELSRYRGGDRGGFRAYNASINQLGSVRLSSIAPYLTGVESTKAIRGILMGMHLELINEN